MSQWLSFLRGSLTVPIINSFKWGLSCYACQNRALINISTFVWQYLLSVLSDVLSFVSSLRSFTICKVSSILQWRKDTFTGYFITLYYLASQPSKTEARQKTEAVPHLNHWKASFQHQQAAGYSNDFNEVCHQLSFIQSCVDVILSFCFLPQEILWSLAQVYFYSCMQCIPFLFK